jgi:hypothetical protein
MSYIYLLESGEESLAECYSDIPVFVLSRLNLTVEKFYSKDSATESSHSSQYGTTCEHSMAGPGMERLKSLREGFLASISQSLEKVEESMGPALVCGLKCPVSFAKLDPDSYSWKTHQLSLFEDLVSYSETWPEQGTMLNGQCWEVSHLEVCIDEKEFGYWATPRATQAAQPNYRKSRGVDYSRANLDEFLTTLFPDLIGKRINRELLIWMMIWPTGWARLKPLEMDKFQQWQQQHSEFCQKELTYE